MTLATFEFRDDASVDPEGLDSSAPSDSGREDASVDPLLDGAVDDAAIDGSQDAGFECASCTWGCVATRCASLVEIRAGGNHTCARSESGEVWCWGRNTSGELGDGTRITRTRPARVSGISDAVQIAVGHSHTCARHDDGGVSCWGNGARGRLGLGTGTPASVPTPTRVEGLTAVDIAAGLDATCSVSSTGEVRCWGNNANGQLGLDPATTSLTSPSTPVPTIDGSSVSVGAAHACAVTRGGGVSCWGRDVEGQLGNGSGDEFDSLAPVPVALSEIVEISAGSVHTCARDDFGLAHCWGAGTVGELGDGRRMSSTAPLSVSAPDRMPWIQIAAGNQSTAARTGARAWSWGGGLNLGAASGERGGPGFIDPPLTSASDVSIGSGHGCALSSDGQAFCWGANTDGQLGDGTNDLSTVPVPVLDPI
ncbi:MAG: hypothetical protein H6719_21625 [Sandaracinaceae bacterium]|nr:hypothetical protein [Sandaracinaceae bacterium]